MLVLIVGEEVAGQNEGDTDGHEEAYVAPYLQGRLVLQAILDAG